MPDAGAASAGASSAEREYGCLTCVVKFDSSIAQRAHMRSDRQYVQPSRKRDEQTTDKGSVHNLKRRMESLPPLSEAEFHEQSLPSTTKTSNTVRSRNTELQSRAPIGPGRSPSPAALSSEEDQSADEGEDFSPQQCLFCNEEAASLESNLTHMSHAHGFFTSNAEYLIDMESFLSYLFALVSVFRECLFCGSPKNTKFGVQDHMREKGHCKLNLEDDEHQLSQFYDFSETAQEHDDEEKQEEEVTPVLEEGELLLPSGKIVGRRSGIRSSHHHNTKRTSPGTSLELQQRSPETELEIAPTGPDMESPVRTIVMRKGTSTSLIGLSGFQRRALMAVELKAEKMEAKARNEYQSKVEKGGNKQKTYRVLSMGKKAGGLEKRLG